MCHNPVNPALVVCICPSCKQTLTHVAPAPRFKMFDLILMKNGMSAIQQIETDYSLHKLNNTEVGDQWRVATDEDIIQDLDRELKRILVGNAKQALSDKCFKKSRALQKRITALDRKRYAIRDAENKAYYIQLREIENAE